MSFGPLAFLSPWLLAALLTLPIIYWLLRAVPPRPAQVEFPPTRILVGLENDEKTADKTPWWLTLLRLLAATLVILALADPVLNPTKDKALQGDGPVVLVIDNGWSASSRWPERVTMIERLIAEAESAQRAVMIAPTAATGPGVTFKIEAPSTARSTAAALLPQPFAPDRSAAANAVDAALKATGASGASIVWLHDGIDHNSATQVIVDKLATLSGGGSFAVIDEAGKQSALGLAARLGEKGKLEAIVSAPSGAGVSGSVHAFSARGERLGEAPFNLAPGATRAEIGFDLPLELRNQVARIEIPSERSAGAVSLIDAATQWHRVGLISGENREQAQPLLAPLYYIQKALAPYAELALAKDSNLEQALYGALRQNVSVMMLADIGTLSGEPAKKVEEFVKRGGMLVRFAGPRLEKGGDELLPVVLRAGGRSLGGALSWSSPQPLAAFDDASPFAGLTIPADVTVNRQVLADPARLTPETEIWARLKDGTPLVTAVKRGAGRIVLFHVTANSDWSNLPISGLFVDMMRRLSTMGNIGAAAGLAGEAGGNAADATATEDSANMLAPQRTLDGFGALKPPPPTAEPIKAADLGKVVPGFDHPPGYYGSSGSPRALNVLTEKSTLLPFPSLPSSVQHLSYANAASTLLKPWLLGLALLILFADILASLVLQAGGLAGLRRSAPRAAKATAAALALAITAAALPVGSTPAQAQSPFERERGAPLDWRMPGNSFGESRDKPPPTGNVGIDATRHVTFGYVLSGNREIDETSRAGLQGLARVLDSRTAVEPGDPIGVDIAKDEIAFFPILYWPVLDTTEALPDAAVAKIDAYMKEGGLIIFDTRDYGQGGSQVLALSGKGGNALQRLLAKLDVPRLEPVPDQHVLTKSFYLLRSFPGRWDGGELWVEAIANSSAETHRARVADGVTSIMITSNDLAAAWAQDERGRSLYPVVPGGEMQREMAYRAGVNIVMHALTGNYKADQVHVPALLERLGQ